MGHSNLKDGTWIWPEGFAHHVDEHHLPMQDEFVESLLAPQCVVPILPTEIEQITHVETHDAIDTTFWNDWATRVQNGLG